MLFIIYYVQNLNKLYKCQKNACLLNCKMKINPEQYIYKVLKNNIRKNGYANFLVSGGKSLKKIFKSLSRKKLKWDKIRLFLTDERCVSSHHPNSNEKNIRENFIKFKAKKIILYPLNFNKKMKINKIIKKKYFKSYYKNKFDLALIGMGSDGHFASIFSSISIYKKLIDAKEKPAIYLVERAGQLFYKRITINLSMIIKSKKIILLINNRSKLNKLKSAILLGRKSNLPVSELIHGLKNRINISYKNNLIKINKYLVDNKGKINKVFNK